MLPDLILYSTLFVPNRACYKIWSGKFWYKLGQLILHTHEKKYAFVLRSTACCSGDGFMQRANKAESGEIVENGLISMCKDGGLGAIVYISPPTGKGLGQ